MSFSADLVRRVDPSARLLGETPLTGGVSAGARRLDCEIGGQPVALVLRRHREIDGKPPAADRARTEAAILARLPGLGVPAPALRLFAAPDSLILDFVDGVTDPPPGTPDSLVLPLAKALADLHKLGPEAGLQDLGRFTDPLPDLRVWRPDLFGPGAPACPAFAGPPRLLHGDVWAGNLLWREGRLVALLDWEDACLGDPMADLAAARSDLHRAYGPHAADALSEAYGRLAPVDASRLSWWDLYMATAQLTHMDSWGLPPEDLAQRRMAACQGRELALSALGFRGPVEGRAPTS